MNTILKTTAANTMLLAILWTGGVQAQNRIDIQRPDAPELAAYGEFETGTRPIELVNPGQLDVLALDPASEAPLELPLYDRPLTVQMWYPSFPGASGRQ